MITYDRAPMSGVTIYHCRKPIRRLAEEHELRTFAWQLAIGWDHTRVETPDGAVRLSSTQAADLLEHCAMHLRQITEAG